jgi:hypothetical protein
MTRSTIGLRPFRHFVATSYLEEHPEDFETPQAMLGHAWSKTTRI